MPYLLCRTNHPSPSSSGDLRAVLKNLVWRKRWTRLKKVIFFQCQFLPSQLLCRQVHVGQHKPFVTTCRSIPSTFFKLLGKTTLKLGDSQGRDQFSHYFESLKWMGDKWIYTLIFPVVIRSGYTPWLLLPAWKQIAGIKSSHVLESRAILFEIKG